MSQTQKKRRSYRWTNKIQEDHASPLYSIVFNFCSSTHQDVFAACGGNRVTVYQCFEGGDIQVLQAYVDDDKIEQYYVCCWSIEDRSGSPLLLVAGHTGKIKCINCQDQRLRFALIGHGNSVNDLKIHPSKSSLLLSASKDESVRLWNIKTRTLVYIFGGDGGHRNEVLSIDFHPSGDGSFVSAGMDNTIKLWSTAKGADLITKSDAWDMNQSSKFPTKVEQHPYLSTNKVHANYVDCVRWLGNFILSKSVDNKIILWKHVEGANPSTNASEEESVQLLQEYTFTECDIWYMRFSMDFNCNVLALGNRTGKIYVWEVNTSPPILLGKLANNQCRRALRQTACNYNGTTILACSEDGTIWRWDCGGNADNS